MSVNYSIQPIKAQPGKYYMRLESKGTRSEDLMIRNIADKTGRTPAEVRAVISAEREELLDAAANGESGIFDDYIGMEPTIRAGAPITDPNHNFVPGVDRLFMTIEVKNAVQREVRALNPLASDYVKVAARVREPQINRVFDWNSQQIGKYTPGGLIEVTGVDLDLPNDLATDVLNGVFFKAGATETRATVYQTEGNLKITCFVPASVIAAAIDVIVRSDYAGPTLKQGTISGVVKA